MKKIMSCILCLVYLMTTISASSGLSPTDVRVIVIAPNVCGDGAIGNKEECDKNNFGNSSCLTKGYSSGKISCTSECTFNESLCVYVEGFVSSAGEDVEIFGFRECNDGIDNDKDNLIDFPNDKGCSNVLDNSESDSICESDWQEGPWGECIVEIQVKRIIDVNHCKSDYLKNETQACFSVDEKDSNIFGIPLSFPKYEIIQIALFIGAFIFIVVYLIAMKIFKEYRKKSLFN